MVAHTAILLLWWNDWVCDQKLLEPVAPLCPLPQDQMVSL